MSNYIKIKKGLDIPLKGTAESTTDADNSTILFGICPEDFPGHIWKARVKPGDKVKIGTRLLSDKSTDTIALVSPVAGFVKEIIRGERRRILAVTIEKKDEQTSDTFDIRHNPEEIRKTLKDSGLWSLLRQRPFDIVPETDSTPRDIFITGFDSAPLAPELISTEDIPYVEMGIKILFMLTSGKVYLGVRPDKNPNIGIAETIQFEGPHPAGNVGVQIAAVKPVNKGEVVWTTDIRTVARIGKLYKDNILDYSTTVAVTGPEVENPHFVKTCAGASLSTILEGFKLHEDKNLRIISGNVLTGIKVEKESGFLRFPYRQISVIEEGDSRGEFMGWASMNPEKYSVKRSFPAFLKGLSRPFNFDARIKGGHRAMILSEEYDKVFPFDIYPEYLIKAIGNFDIDRMEKLGIYEVAPEDFALPEFVDTSKIELQKIVREGLDKLREEI
ncbi:MAG: Na(+)-translocating NADH-quinone reductase subunit A [Muribaculaceae bacterium]|nr:Na(+)-translocating NADH-quinone reductase subunit A [Muribaculaceae bacterium]